MTIAVVDSSGANIASVVHALRRLGAEPEFTADAETIRAADRVILPGVGAAGTAMEALKNNGLVDLIRGLSQPVLGVCLGMQLLFDTTEEGDVGMLGLIPERVRRLPAEGGLRVPHMGWNTIQGVRSDPLLDGLTAQYFYFVHSYAAPVGDWTVATAEHGRTFSAVVQRRNFRGAQFHPERSAKTGAKFLKRFLELEAS